MVASFVPFQSFVLRLRFLVILWCIIGTTFSCKGPSTTQDPSFTLEMAQATEQAAWETVPGILARIQEPTFRDEIFRVTDYGAQTDSTFDSRPGIIAAIEACVKAGGGQVVIPAGRFLSNGPIHLKSNVRLHLEEGAYLRFGANPKDYLPLVKVRWEGTVCWNYSPLIYAYQQKNIAVTGSGTIDGASHDFFFSWRPIQKPDKARLRQMGNDLVPEDQRVFGEGFLDLDGDGKDDGFGDGQPHYLRPSLIELYECENILLEGLTLRESAFWTTHPVFCKNVTIRGLKVFGSNLNDDGIDPDSCEDVLIEDCYIETVDDAISIKAGRDQDAWNRKGSQSIVVRNCRLNSGVNSFCVGSEMSGGAKNVFVENCHILSGKHGLNFKCNLDRGGQVERIFMRNIRIDSVKQAMFIFRMDYHGYRGNNFPTKFNDFYASNIQCNLVEEVPFKLVGVEAEPLRRIFLNNISIKKAGQKSQLEFANEVLANRVQVNGAAWQPDQTSKDNQ